MTLSVYSKIVSEYRPNKAGWTFPVDQTICHQIPTALLSSTALVAMALGPCMHTVPLHYLCRLGQVTLHAVMLQTPPRSYCSPQGTALPAKWPRGLSYLPWSIVLTFCTHGHLFNGAGIYQYRTAVF